MGECTMNMLVKRTVRCTHAQGSENIGSGGHSKGIDQVKKRASGQGKPKIVTRWGQHERKSRKQRHKNMSAEVIKKNN